MDVWKTAFILTINMAASVGGSSALKFAVTTGNPFFATLGCVCWSITASTFLMLAKEQALGVIAVVTNALVLLTVTAIGAIFFDETITRIKLAGLLCIIAGLVLMGWAVHRT